MDPTAHPALTRLVARARGDPEILAVILFGSRARGEDSSKSDFDICLVVAPDAGSDLARARKRLEYLSTFELDVAVFQRLPLHIRSRVLKEGAVLFVRDEDALYDLAFRTARAFEDFRHIYRQYLAEIARD